MAEAHNPETPHERRVTWSLMAVVVAFVFLMTCIVLWITSSLIRQELGGSGRPVSPDDASPTGPATATLPPPSATPLLATTTDTTVPDQPVLVDATWTPAPEHRYVRFLYWFVKPNRIRQGECLQLTWQTEYAVSLQLYRNDELILDDAPPSSTIQDCPKRLGYAVYRLVAQNSAGESNWIQLQVKVEAAP